MTFILMISLFILVLGYLQLNTTVKMVPLQQHGRIYLSVKTANARIFSTVNRK